MAEESLSYSRLSVLDDDMIVNCPLNPPASRPLCLAPRARARVPANFANFQRIAA
jgi:hypothetical protein